MTRHEGTVIDAIQDPFDEDSALLRVELPGGYRRWVHSDEVARPIEAPRRGRRAERTKDPLA